METGTQLFQVAENIWTWEHFSDAHKVELTSQAVLKNGTLFVFDPAEAPDKIIGQLTSAAPRHVIVLTNENHERACNLFAEKLNAPIFIGAHSQLHIPGANRLPIGNASWEGWLLHPLPGAAPGEIAFESVEDSLMVFGDAIINPASRGPGVLPEQYCVDHRALENELIQLVNARNFNIALTAHGKPLTMKAVNRIRLLLRLQSDIPPQSPKN